MSMCLSPVHTTKHQECNVMQDIDLHTVPLKSHQGAGHSTTTTVLRPLCRTTCIIWHPPVKNWRILLEQSFPARVPLLMATNALRLGRRSWSFQWCYLHCLCTGTSRKKIILPPSPQGSHSPYILGDTTRPRHITCPSLIEIGPKTAEKNFAQTNKETNKQTDRQTDTMKIMVTWP